MYDVITTRLLILDNNTYAPEKHPVIKDLFDSFNLKVSRYLFPSSLIVKILYK